ncbi:MAG: hypothetical protein GY810_13285 [Aureispira sp.]|nr:hypothetical protein [Aureispira sp.]
MHKYGYLLIFILGLVACGGTETEEKQDEPALAKAHDQVLYASDMDGIGAGLSSEDSLYQVKMYIEKWIQDKLLLEVAESNVSNLGKIDRLVAEYRASLILNQYEQALVQERLDSSVTPQQLADYYTKNKEQYQFGLSWVRCHFVKVYRKMDGVKDLRKWFKSDDGLDFDRVKLYCSENKTVHILDEDTWIRFDKLLNQIPKSAIERRHLEGRSVLDKTDDNHQYLLRIFEYRDKNEATPLQEVKEEVRRIILHQRRSQILQDVRREIYQKGKTDDSFEIY